MLLVIGVVIVAALMLAGVFALAFSVVLTAVFNMDTLDHDIETKTYKETK